MSASDNQQSSQNDNWLMNAWNWLKPKAIAAGNFVGGTFAGFLNSYTSIIGIENDWFSDTRGGRYGRTFGEYSSYAVPAGGAYVGSVRLSKNVFNTAKNLSNIGKTRPNASLSGLSGKANKANKAEYDSKGNLISREPKSIQDQMTLEAAKKDKGEVKIKGLGDKRYKGMNKMEHKVKSKEGKDSVVHFVEDPKTGKRMDFKFKKHSID